MERALDSALEGWYSLLMDIRCRLGRHKLFPIGWGHARCFRCLRSFSLSVTTGKVLYEYRDLEK
jgi:hypothetical protein